MLLAIVPGMNRRHLMTAASLSLLVAACSSAPGDDVGTTAAAASSSGVTTLRGVDSARVFSDAEAKRLKDDHGVRWTGVYIGGACSAGDGWSRGSVESIHNATGWSFLPIYVGQESSGICHAHELTKAQGEADAHHAASLMHDFGWDAKRDIPVTLDVEEGTFADDAAATINYVRAWVDTVKADGYEPYVYSSPTAVDAFAREKLAISAAWVASYFYSGFENVTPYSKDLENQVGDHFHDHNRAWQYAGGVNIEGVGNVDCNVSDLDLAPAPGGTNIPAKPSIVELATANLDKHACSENSEHQTGYYTSCHGNDGSPEYWCADFARWTWLKAGKDVSELSAAAGSFYEYGERHGTLHDSPAVGDAVVFNYVGGGVAEHVAIVSKVESDGRIETISGDWDGQSGTEAHFASTSRVVRNTPAYGHDVGTEPGVMGMKISKYVSPVN
jgi:hypothetical protein